MKNWRKKLSDGYSLCWVDAIRAGYEGDAQAQVRLRYNFKEVGKLDVLYYLGPGPEDNTVALWKECLSSLFLTLDYSGDGCSAYEELRKNPTVTAAAIQFGFVFLETAKIDKPHRGKNLCAEMIRFALEQVPYGVVMMYPNPLGKTSEQDGQRRLRAYYQRHFPALEPLPSDPNYLIGTTGMEDADAGTIRPFIADEFAERSTARFLKWYARHGKAKTSAYKELTEP